VTEREHLGRCADAWAYIPGNADLSNQQMLDLLEAEAGVDFREMLARAVRRPMTPPPSAVLEH
jgi:hypothetical protein